MRAGADRGGCRLEQNGIGAGRSRGRSGAESRTRPERDGVLTGDGGTQRSGTEVLTGGNGRTRQSRSGLGGGGTRNLATQGKPKAAETREPTGEGNGSGWDLHRRWVAGGPIISWRRGSAGGGRAGGSQRRGDRDGGNNGSEEEGRGNGSGNPERADSL